MFKHAIIAGCLLALSIAAASAADNLKKADWKLVTPNAGWPGRDSQGELVYKDKMWIFGGWFDSFSAPPRDVWSTSDGKKWNIVEKNAPWKHSDLPMTLVFDERMWLMGGWYNGRLPGHSASNEVWSSTDGKTWKKTRRNADWTPRLAAAAVTFKGKMWLLGGIENYLFGDDKSLKNDVWSSADGENWTLATKNAPWSPRAYHQAVVFDGKIWIFGGGNYVPKHHALNDVWCSEDGANWTKVTDSAQWGPRLWFSALVYRDRMWVIGGWSKKTDNYGDVWHSRNGKNWTQLESDTVWKSRHEHSALVFQDKIWVMGGLPRPNLSNEVWSLDIPPE
jgi:hypothetical protein